MKTSTASSPQIKYSGFTLVELIVVITILAILGTIGFVQMNGFASSARDSRRVSDMSNIQKAIDIAIVTQGVAPTPSLSTVYTGGTVSIQVGKADSSSIPKMSGDFSDPLTQEAYNYSVFGNGLYYQLGIDFENALAFSHHQAPPNTLEYCPSGSLSCQWKGLSQYFPLIRGTLGVFGITPVYAADTSLKYSRLSGNYLFDPSLPSLFPIASTINSSSGGIFSPDVCFVMEGSSTNTFGSSSGSCVAKKDVVLNGLDTSLVGYWDMESYFQSGSLYYLEDLSWNNNDGVFSGGMNPTTVGTLTGGIIGKWLNFSNTGECIEIKDNWTWSFIDLNNYTIIIAFNMQKNWFYGNWIFSKGIYPNYNYQVNIINFSWTNYIPKLAWRAYSYGSNTYFFETRMNWIIKRYINGVKVLETKWTNSDITNNKNLIIGKYLGDNLYQSFWLIDDIKIYNRALSDSEIKQHAKIAGFN